MRDRAGVSALPPIAPPPRLITAPTLTPSKQYWPKLRRGTQKDFARLSELRGVDAGALQIADSVGGLRFGVWKSQPAWFITDDTRVNLQARRMDGRLWPGLEIKAQTLPGAKASWPIGIREARYYPAILLVEGGPDLLAALHFHYLERDLISSCPVAMLGASNKIPDDALALFAEKRVRIYEHDDAAGDAAAGRGLDN